METFLVWLGIAAFVVVAIVIAERRTAAANNDADKIKCPYCHERGKVAIRLASRKKGISGGKAAGGVMTGGTSLFLTGLSRNQGVRELTCGNCGMKWDVA